MRKIFIFLNLIGLLIAAGESRGFSKSDFEIPVEVIEVKDLGLSDRDESKSLIEVRWQTVEIQKDKISAFRVSLSVTYADGTRIVENRRFEKDVFSARLEVPSVKQFGGRPTAFIKKIEAEVTALTISKN